MASSRQDFFTKKPSKATFSGGTIRTPQQHHSLSSIWRVLALVLAVVCAGAYLFWKQSWEMILPTHEVESVTGYQIASQIQEEGILKEERADLINYTHTLTNAQGELFYLKSSKVPLANYANNFSGVVQIVGTIAALYQERPLIEVEIIGSQTANALEQKEVESELIHPSGMYFAEAGLYFGPAFFEKYTFVGTPGANGEFVLQNLDTNAITKINFFACTNVGDTNCHQLVSTFKGTAIKTSTNLDGDAFYLLETGSRFFQNNNWRGYFIHDAQAAEVEQIKNLTSLASPSLIARVVSQQGIKTCLGTDNGLNRIASHTVKKTAQNLEITMQGTGEKEFICLANLDLSKPTQLNFIDIKLGESKPVATETWSQVSTPSQPQAEQKVEEKTVAVKEMVLDTKVAQFPTSTEKTFTYTSSRGGYSLTLPSMNIAYEAFSLSQDFGISGVSCKYGIRVIQHKKKELLASEPALMIYECKANEKLAGLGGNFLVKHLGEKAFVFEIRDSSFVNFANAVSINAL